MAFITFYDLRHADKAKRELQDTELGGRKIDVHYSLPKEDTSSKDEDDKNKGTLFVTVREATEDIDNVALKKLFEQWGAIKEVRDCTGNPGQKFVECWDLRDSAAIVQERQGVQFSGGRLDIKYAYHSTPRDRRSEPPRSGPVRSSLSQRQVQIRDYNRGPVNYGPTQMLPSRVDVGALLAALLSQNVQSPQQLNPSSSSFTVQQLAYLLSLQQQLNTQNQRNNLLNTSSAVVPTGIQYNTRSTNNGLPVGGVGGPVVGGPVVSGGRGGLVSGSNYGPY